jgi:hypothetical protein
VTPGFPAINAGCSVPVPAISCRVPLELGMPCRWQGMKKPAEPAATRVVAAGSVVSCGNRRQDPAGVLKVRRFSRVPSTRHASGRETAKMQRITAASPAYAKLALGTAGPGVEPSSRCVGERWPWGWPWESLGWSSPRGRCAALSRLCSGKPALRSPMSVI